MRVEFDLHCSISQIKILQTEKRRKKERNGYITKINKAKKKTFGGFKDENKWLFPGKRTSFPVSKKISFFKTLKTKTTCKTKNKWKVNF